MCVHFPAVRQHHQQQKRLEALQAAIDLHEKVIFDLTLELQKVYLGGRRV